MSDPTDLSQLPAPPPPADPDEAPPEQPAPAPAADPAAVPAVPYASAPAPAAAADVPPVDQPAPAPAAKVSPGQLVSFSWDDYREGAGGAVVTRYGVVVDVQSHHPDGSERIDADGNADPGARIAWLEPPSDPVSLHDLRVV